MSKVNKTGKTYCAVVKGTKESLEDELHVLYFKTNKESLRYKFPIPKDSVTWTPDFEKFLNTFIASIVNFEKGNLRLVEKQLDSI
jgi:hypothetical protein